MGKLSPHSVGSGVPKTGSVPAFNNVVETSPASSVVKIPFGGSSAVEFAFSIGGLEQWQTGAAIVGGFPSTAVWCKHDIYRKRQSATVNAFGNRSKLATGNHLHPGKSNKPEPKRKSTYCKGPHPSYNCNVITDCQQRWSIIRRESLCFNCLGNHKSSICPSRYCCHKCKLEHHTSLCSGELSPCVKDVWPTWTFVSCHYQSLTTDARTMAAKTWVGWTTSTWTQNQMEQYYKRHSQCEHERMPPQSIYMYLQDSSPKAYGAVAYVSNDHHFLKSWQSLVPQLELLAALVGARLPNVLSRALKPRYPNLKVKLWSDSEIILHWLRSIKQLKPFIGNRTREIKSLFPLWEWNHCPTNENPADLLTRGINTTQLHSSALWTHGPHWLPFESHWPSWNPSQVLHVNSADAVDSETTTDESTQTEPAEEKTGIQYVIDVSRYSTVRRLLAVTAYVLGFAKNLQNRETRTTGPLSTKEPQVVHQKWTKDCQRVT